MSVEILRSAIKKHISDIVTLDNVVGVGIGPKEIDGRCTKDLAVKVLVSQKVSDSKLRRSQCVPQMLDNSAATDVIEVGELKLLMGRETRKDRVRPARGGVGISHFLVSAGTLGAVVKDKKDGSLLMLSNNHVIANMTDGEDARAEKGDIILQPAAYDGGRAPDDVIGHLDRFVPLMRQSGFASCPIAKAAERVANKAMAIIGKSYEVRVSKLDGVNYVDAAAARPVNEEDLDPNILGIGVPKGMTTPQVGMRVKKSGLSSGMTYGEIKVTEATVKVGLAGAAFAVFADQIITTAMASPGDSGSLGVSEDNYAFGLLAAGSQIASVYCRLDFVLEKMACELITEE